MNWAGTCALRGETEGSDLVQAGEAMASAGPVRGAESSICASTSEKVVRKIKAGLSQWGTVAG